MDAEMNSEVLEARAARDKSRENTRKSRSLRIGEVAENNGKRISIMEILSEKSCSEKSKSEHIQGQGGTCHILVVEIGWSKEWVLTDIGAQVSAVSRRKLERTMATISGRGDSRNKVQIRRQVIRQ